MRQERVLARMPDRCVVANCSNTANPENSIFVHTTPFFGEAIRRRKKWVDFVKTKRARWEPTKHSAVYSEHSKEDDYIIQYTLPPELSRKPKVPRLKAD